MNASANTSSPQLETLVSWFWKKLIRLEAIFRPHPDREKVVITPLGCLMSGVCVRKASVTSEKLWRERGDRE